MTIRTLSALEFSRLHQQGLHLVDVRSTAEHAGRHVEGAICHPLGEWEAESLLADLKQRGFGEGDTLYLLCQAGRRAQMAAEKIAANSAVDVVVVEGGTQACIEAGLPLRSTGKPVMALERQVRIAAGFLVLSGVLLGAMVSPVWYGLSGFVGAGLMFAGITNTCAMGMLIARMPWNRA
ncbi:MAG: rhodanese-like domain-containing protein [Moraxellaceae bacterium]